MSVDEPGIDGQPVAHLQAERGQGPDGAAGWWTREPGTERLIFVSDADPSA